MTPAFSRRFAGCLLACAALLPAGICQAQAVAGVAPRAPVPVENFSGEPWVGAYVAEQASAPLLALFQQRPGLAVYAETYRFDAGAQRVCVAHVGLTHAAGPALQPRAPVRLFWGAASGPGTEPAGGRGGCNGRALVRALDKAIAASLASLTDELDRTQSSGGTRDAEPADATQVWNAYTGLTDRGNAFLVGRLPGWFARAFDHRQVQLRTVFNRLDADDGQRLCLATLGLTARAPRDRTTRLPAAGRLWARLFSAADAHKAVRDEACFDPAFDALARELVPGAGLVAEFIARWPAVAEPGLEAPTLDALAAAVAQAERPRPAGR